MEVILLKDVKDVGKADDIVKVSDGYARNYIIRNGLGVQATPKALNELKTRKKVQAVRDAEKLAEAQALAARIEKSPVNVGLKIGEGGRVFGSVSAKEVADALKTQGSISIDKKKLVMEPIKNIGEYDVGVKLHPEVTATLRVKVTEAK